MKVKIFNGSYSELEEQINEWLEKFPGDIIKICTNRSGSFGSTVFIFYEV